MEHLKIQHVGAIVNVDVDLKKVNVLIGPQSSGKSTVCKIACYCSWVEKKVCLDQSFKFFEKEGTFHEELVRFHRLKGYLRDNSYIEYESDALKFRYDHGKGRPEFEWKERYAYKRGKIAYIPSERNIVSAIKNWFEVKFEDNNIQSFMIDWTNARKGHTSKNPLPVLELGVKYYFDEASERNLVTVDKDVMLDLMNTSSGLQSIIPLEVVVEYMMTRVYENGTTARSISAKKRDRLLSEALFEDLFNHTLNIPAKGGTLPLYIQSNSDEVEVRVRYDDSSETTMKLRPDSQKTFYTDSDEKELFVFTSKEEAQRYNMMREQLLSVQYTKLFVEEPEQNLFPETQRDLLYYLLTQIKTRDDHRLFITTHSPYVLSALNNCLAGYLVKDAMPAGEQSTLKSRDAWINPAAVSAHEITEGMLKSVQNEGTGTIGKHYFNRISNAIMDEYYDMLTYLGE